MPEPFVPTPPEGYVALAHTAEKAQIEDRNRPPSVRGVRQPLRGVLVYAEREWKPVVDFRGIHGRKIDVDYAESKAPGATHEGVYMQRLPAERIAIDPIAHPKVVEYREHAAQQAAAHAARLAEYEAGRAERDAARAEARAEVRAEEAAERAAKLAALPPQQRLAVVRRQLAKVQALVESRREQAAEAQERLADAEQLAEKLSAQETELVAEQGEYQ